MKKAERVLIYRDYDQINVSRDKAESAIPHLQRLIDAAEGAGLNITADNFYHASSKPETWAKKQYENMIPEEDVKVGVFKKKRASIIDTLELPSMEDFKRYAFDFFSFVRTNLVPVNLLTIEQGKAVINRYELEAMTEHCSTYISHKTEIRIWHELVSLFEQVNRVNDLLEAECQSTGIDAFNFGQFISHRDGKLIPRVSKFRELTERIRASEA